MSSPEPEPTGAPPPADADVSAEVDTAASADIDAEVAALEGRVAELTDQWLRARAELDNARKRSERELGRAHEEERVLVTREWLPILDNLERALAHAGASPESIIEGVEAVTDQALQLVRRLGFPRQDDLGERFDPTRHAAAESRPAAEAAPGTVIEVLQPGYGTGDHQLRPALVVVAQGE